MAGKYATADTVSHSELLAFVRPRHHMVLTTFRTDGSLQSSPVTGGVDDAGRIVIASYPQRAKSANIRRRPRASITVLSDEFNGPYVQVDGDGEVIDCPTPSSRWSTTTGPSRVSIPTGRSTAKRWSTRASA
jgi:PPOX class probable F420-dependent enzyme